ncbi:MAG: 2-oxoacid:acceptor oxidoreductase family protein [Pirellulaceae bacterium]|nr:2-oxoacid:acceptor oxidoreductase family protein [Pirellulaceae bacterium]MDP6720736.1 2-oxoacid:acceptor oxidoreductase family protein [Pirellulaceae bacterium]
MIRIRFHGRGGHGIKTASRIVGTAAFLSGYYTQDSPIYGAERRGAAIVAFTRIDSEPILERGVIAEPDLIVVGDETLLSDSAAGVSAGQQSARAVFINIDDASGLAEEYRIQPAVIALDVTARTLNALGTASALSVGLAAATARLIGIIEQEQLREAAREELGHTGLADEQIEANLVLAARLFNELSPVAEIGAVRAEPQVVGSVATVPHHLPILSTPSILAAGNAEERQTGAWRFERPEIDYDVCTRCGICFVRCPDGAIALNEEGYPVIDYDHCKGCMECWDQCPVEGAIRKEKEVRAW